MSHLGIQTDEFQAKSHYMKVSKEYVRDVALAFVRRARTPD